MIKRLEPFGTWLYTLSGIVILAGLFCFLLIIQPLTKEVEATEHKLDSINTEIDGLTNQLEKATTVNDPDDLVELVHSIPVTPSVQHLIQDLAQLEKKTKVAIHNISFHVDADQSTSFTDVATLPEELKKLLNEQSSGIEEESKENTMLSSVSFTINLTGDYASLMNFIKSYDELPRTIHFEQIEFTNELSQEYEGDVISATITISAYYIGPFAPYIENKIDIGEKRGLKLNP